MLDVFGEPGMIERSRSPMVQMDGHGLELPLVQPKEVETVLDVFGEPGTIEQSRSPYGLDGWIRT